MGNLCGTCQGTPRDGPAQVAVEASNASVFAVPGEGERPCGVPGLSSREGGRPSGVSQYLPRRTCACCVNDVRHMDVSTAA